MGDTFFGKSFFFGFNSLLIFGLRMETGCILLVFSEFAVIFWLRNCLDGSLLLKVSVETCFFASPVGRGS